MATRVNAVAAPRSLRVFYRDYANAVAIPSTSPESLPANRVAPLAEQLLASADNFLGVVDRNDTILQCYLADDPAHVTLELVYPEATGCLRLTLPRDQALQCLGDLPKLFGEDLLPGAQYIA